MSSTTVAGNSRAHRRDYAIVTSAYWTFTVTDGALRMLVLLHFHDLGYSPVSLAFLFLLYEFFGVVTNLVGGWIGTRRGLNQTLIAGLTLQAVALTGLSFQRVEWSEIASVMFVMAAQALSGIAKDLTKMSSKSAVKLVADGDGALFRWVAVLTGSKNALKGLGFFVGGALLGAIGFAPALRLMAGAIALALIAVLVLLRTDLGRATSKPPLASLFAKSPEINRLSAARFFLFGSRDIWFVVALPVFLADQLDWSFSQIGGFLALWVIAYGGVQAFAPQLLGEASAGGASGRRWAVALVVVTAALATIATASGADAAWVIVVGLGVFGLVFAVNSSLHSYLILAFSEDDDVAMNVGFYYSANAAGRLVGTLASGVLALVGGLGAALWAAAAFTAAAAALLPRQPLSLSGSDLDLRRSPPP